MTTASSSSRCRSSRPISSPCSPHVTSAGQASAGSGHLRVLGGEDRGLGAAGQAELGEHRGHVVLHGLLGEVHALGDLPVGQALADQVEDPLLLLGELRQLLVHRRPVAHPVEHLRRHRRVEHRLAGGDPADGVDEVVAPDLLEDVAGGAGHDRGEQRLVVVVRRQDQRLDVRVRERTSRQTSMPEPSGSRAVEDGDVRPQGRDPPGGLLGQPGLADDLDVAARPRAAP